MKQYGTCTTHKYLYLTSLMFNKKNLEVSIWSSNMYKLNLVKFKQELRQ